MKTVRLLLSVIFLHTCACACTKVAVSDSAEDTHNPCTVSFRAGQGIDVDAKTVMGADGVSVGWTPSDKLYLWAVKSGQSAYTFSCKEFGVYGLAQSFAYFTAVLDSPMSDGRYTYYCCSPAPSKQENNKLFFEIPFAQDGSGQGIMMSKPTEAGALKNLDDYVETEALSLSMDQMAHLLQLYLKDDAHLLGGEKVNRAVMTFPGRVVGMYYANISAPQNGLTEYLASSTIFVEPQEGLAASSSSSRKYVYACMAPKQWQASDVLNVKLYSATKVAECKSISLKGRNMKQGHATPVCLEPSTVKNYCNFNVILASNPIGEPITSFTMTAPSGCRWGDDGDNVFTYAPVGDVPVGTSFKIGYEEESFFRAMSGKTVSVTFQSEHVSLSRNITIPVLDGKYSCDLKLDVPYLLKEDFSTVPTFSSNDEYATWKTGSYSAYSFLNGWTGARIGAQGGKCIRIACRRETSADYDARVDSAPLNCTFKKSTNINVAFSYGSNNKYGGIAIITDGNVGQNCYVGYVTSTTAYESSDGTGTFDRSANTFYTKEYNGSYTNTPNDTDYTIKGIPAGTSPVRITWHTEIEHQAGTTNTTAWLYIDNVVVTIAK